MNNYKSIRTTLNDELLIDEFEKLEFEGRSQSDIVKEALTVYLLEESEDTQISVRSNTLKGDNGRGDNQ